MMSILVALGLATPVAHAAIDPVLVNTGNAAVASTATAFEAFFTPTNIEVVLGVIAVLWVFAWGVKKIFGRRRG